MSLYNTDYYCTSFFHHHVVWPFVQRRGREIRAAHPDVTELIGVGHYDSMVVYKILVGIALQLLSLFLLQDSAWYTRTFCCYTLSGTINHAVTLAIHEATHNLCAKGYVSNRVILILANLPMCIPAGASFRRYHMEHHKFQGEEGLDVDLPTNWEGTVFTTPLRKALWLLLQPLFYSIRPLIVSPKQTSRLELINIAASVAFDLVIVYLFGIGGLLYLVAGTLLGMGIHPVAGHFIAEHYVMHEKQETFSYYGPLNWLTFSVGYHNEHHDFPFIAGKNLPRLRELAPEYYDDIPHYHSWVKVIYDYVMDPALSPFSRTKRVTMSNTAIDELRARGGLVK